MVSPYEIHDELREDALVHTVFVMWSATKTRKKPSVRQLRISLAVRQTNRQANKETNEAMEAK